MDGCFWHQCPEHFTLPASNKSFWKDKINGNLLSDHAQKKELNGRGYQIIRIWEHETKIQPHSKEK